LMSIWEGSSFVGIVPLYLERTSHGICRARQLRFLGLPEAGSDYLNFLWCKGKERAIAHAVVESLFGLFRSRWDTLCLMEIPSDSQSLTQFLLQLRTRGKYYAVEEGSSCPGVVLSGSFETYLKGLSSNRRQKYKYDMRTLLSEGKVVHAVVKGREGLLEAMRPFRKAYEKRWGQSQDLFAFLESYLDKDDNCVGIELSSLVVNGGFVAGLLHLVHHRTMYMYLMAVDGEFKRSISLGNLVCAMNIERAIESGCESYDFLKGEETYKRHWMNQSKRALQITVYNRTIPAIAGYLERSAKGLGKLILR